MASWHVNLAGHWIACAVSGQPLITGFLPSVDLKIWFVRVLRPGNTILAGGWGALACAAGMRCGASAAHMS